MDYWLSWNITEYFGLLLMTMDYGLWWIIMEYGLSWIIVDEWGLSWVMDYMDYMDYCGLLWHSVDYHGLSWILRKCTTMESHGLEDMRLRPLTTPKRYGAGMAHTVVSIGFIDYCRLSSTAWRITVDYWYGLSWAIMDYCGFWTVMVYDGLPWTMDYHALFGITLSWIIVGYLIFSQYHGWWIIVDYPGLAWIVVDYCASLWIINMIMDYGLSCFT